MFNGNKYFLTCTPSSEAGCPKSSECAFWHGGDEACIFEGIQYFGFARLVNPDNLICSPSLVLCWHPPDEEPIACEDRDCPAWDLAGQGTGCLLALYGSAQFRKVHFTAPTE